MFEPIFIETSELDDERPEGCTEDSPNVSTNCLGCHRSEVCVDHLQVWLD